MLILLYGADTFRSREQLKKMVDKFRVDRDPAGYNVVYLNAVTDDPDKVVSQMLTMPFLAEKRLVVLENLLATKKSVLQKKILTLIEENKIPDSNIVVFWEEDGTPKAEKKTKKKAPEKEKKVKKEKEPDPTEKLYSMLSEQKFSQRFDLMSNDKLMTWVSDKIGVAKGKIGQHALQYLVENCAQDVWLLNSTTNQLISYCNDREINTADAELFLRVRADDSVFNLVDAIVSGQARIAFRMLAEQYEKGEDANFVFQMLIRQFRILLKIKDIKRREDTMSADMIAVRISEHPFVVRKCLSQAVKYSEKELIGIYDRLLQMDRKQKLGADLGLELDLFISARVGE